MKASRLIKKPQDRERSLLKRQIKEPLNSFQPEGGLAINGINDSMVTDVEQSFMNDNGPCTDCSDIKHDSKFFNQAYEVPLTSSVQLPEAQIVHHPLQINQKDQNDFTVKQLNEMLLECDKGETVIKEKKSQKGKPYTYLFKQNQDNQEEDNRFKEDPDQDQNFIDEYVDQFKDITSVQKYSVGEKKFIETDWDSLYDDFEGSNPSNSNTPYHRALVCSNNFKMNEWIIEIRKSYKANQGQFLMELFSLTPEGHQENLGQIQLANFKGLEVQHLFNNNLECLFNHMLFGSKLYFFSIHNQGQEEVNLNLNSFKIEENAILGQNSVDIKQIKQVRAEIDGAPLMGVTFIKGLEDESKDYIPGKREPDFFFALIYGRHTLTAGKTIHHITYEIRHSRYRYQTIYTHKVEKAHEEFASPEFHSRSPVLIQIPAQRIFNQLLLTEVIGDEDMVRINNKIKDIQESTLNKKFRSQESINNKKTQAEHFKRLRENYNSLAMFVVGNINNRSFEQVHSFFLIDQEQTYFDTEQLFKIQDIKQTQELLAEYLNTMSLRNTCNIIKFNSHHQKPVVHEKKFCRGQVELIKRVLNMQNINEIQRQATSRDSQAFRRMSSKIVEGFNESQQSLVQNFELSLNKFFEDIWCASLVDFIQRKMTLLCYNRYDLSKQYLFSFELHNYQEIRDVKANPEIQEMNCSHAFCLTGYNDMFFKAFDENQFMNNNKLQISTKYDNVSRDHSKVLWVNQNKLLATSDNEGYLMKAKSEFRTKQDDEVIERPAQQSLNLKKDKLKKSLSGFQDQKTDEFDLDDLDHIVHENVTTVEDDRQDKPVLSVDPNFGSLLFAIIDKESVKAVTSLRLNTDQFLVNIDNKMKRLKYNIDLIQLCASSDIEEGKDVDGHKYMYQNYTVAIMYQKQLRFRMNEYQVRWRQNKDSKTKDSQPYKVEIQLFKVREVVLKKKDENTKINRFVIVPLYERLKSRNSPHLEQSQIPYKITGVQLIVKCRYNMLKSTAFINFRSLLDDQLYVISEQYKEFNYWNRLTITKTKMIEQQNLQGIYVETQFRHQRANDLNSDYVGSGLFDADECLNILRETNTVALNSFPLDFLNLMDLPEINNEWFQRSRNQFNIDDATEKATLDLELVLHKNFKPYFCCWELIGGNPMINSVGLNKNHDNRDQYKILHIFKRLNAQQDDRKYDFKFITDIRTPVFALSLIERTMTRDEDNHRQRHLRKYGLVMDGKDVIGSNLNLESIIQQPLLQHDYKMSDLYVKELYENNTYSENKYTQMMKLLPLVLNTNTMFSSKFFEFFLDSDLQINNDNVDRSHGAPNNEDDALENQFFDDDWELQQDYITFSQYFPPKLNDKLDRYTDIEFQVFTEHSTENLDNLKESSTMMQTFNLLEKKYKNYGQTKEIRPSHLNFKPLILGKKLQQIEKAKNLKELKEVKNEMMNNYILSEYIKLIVEMTHGKIDEQKVIRDIIDFQYIATKKFMMFNLCIVGFGYLVPLIIQMKSSDPEKVRDCNIVCLLVQLYCLVYECISLKAEGAKVYLKSVWNLLDVFTIFLYFAYFCYRINHTGHAIPQLPDDGDHLSDGWFERELAHQLRYYSPVIHIILIVTGFLKLMFYLRVFTAFGEFVQLVLACCNDVKIFLIFFLSWVMIFSVLFQVSGTTFDTKDYNTLPILSYYLQTYRNSIGDIAPPEYAYWEHIHKVINKGKSKVFDYPQLMIYFIWVLWFLNQFFNLIILLNFLIAIVGQSYERVISESIIYQYSHKAELNCETRRFLMTFRKKKPFDIMCVVTCLDAEETFQDQIQGLTKILKNYVKTQIMDLRDDIMSKFAITEKTTEKYDANLKKYVDAQFSENLQFMQEIKNSVAHIQVAQDQALGGEKTNEQKDKILVELMKDMINKTIRNAYQEQQENNELIRARKEVEEAHQQTKQAQEALKMAEYNNTETTKKLSQALDTIQQIQGKLDRQNSETNQLQEQFQNQSVKFDNVLSLVEKINQSFPEQLKEQMKSMQADFDKKLDDIKPQEKAE